MISSALEPFIVSVHMILALIIVSLLTYISLQTYYFDKKITAHENGYTSSIGNWAGLLLLFTFIEVILGTQLRQSFETASALFPLMSSMELVNTIGAIKFVHPLIGLILAAFAVYIAAVLLNKKYQPSYLIWQSAWCLLGLVLIQLVMGVFLMTAELEPVVQVMHLWTSSLMTGVVFIAYISLRQKGVQS